MRQLDERRRVAGFIWTLVRTDFKARYHGTWGGFVWALLKPLAMFVVLLSIFSFIFSSSPDYRLDLVVGLFLWDFFTEGTKTGLTSLHAKGYLITKTRFPTWIVVVTSISNAFITLLAFSLGLLLYLAGSGRTPTPLAGLAYLFYLCCYGALVVGFSLGASVLFLRYRDLNEVWDVVTQAGFFVAPIIYPLDILPERFHFFLYLWPPTPVIQFSRTVLVDGTMPSARAHVALAGVAAVLLLGGASVFRRYAPRAAEYL